MFKTNFPGLASRSIGFDRLIEIMNHVENPDASKSEYPRHDIVQTDNNAYRISLAVAGFTSDDLSVEVKENALVIVGTKSDAGNEQEKYLHHGIATRSFKRSFALGDHLQVVDARHENGLLNVHLERIVPDELKPRRIEISSPEESATITSEETVDAN